ncbi:MAG: MFS transporter, partial [Candidatus Rokuibacteriota bacterium]
APRGRPGAVAPGDGIRGAPALDRRKAMETPAFWWLTAGFVGCGFTDFLLSTHMAAFATDVGLSQAVAANAFSLWAAANVVGILLAGWVAARLDPRRALVATYLVRAASLVVLPGAREPWQLYLFAILFGATFFTTAPLSSTLVGAVFGGAHQGVIFGAATLFHHLAGALGSYAGGLSFDLTGTYGPIFLAGAVMVLLSAGTTALVRRPR